MVQRFFNHLTRDVAFELLGTVNFFRNQQGVQIVARDDVLGFFAGDIGVDGDGRRGHQIFCQPPGLYFFIQQLYQPGFRLRQGFFLNRCRRGIRMTAASDVCQNGAHIHLVDPAARHHINFIFHSCNGKNGIDVFHFDHFLNEEREVRHIFFKGHAGDNDFNSADVIPGHGLDHVIEKDDLFRAQFPGNQIRHDI